MGVETALDQASIEVQVTCLSAIIANICSYTSRTANSGSPHPRRDASPRPPLPPPACLNLGEPSLARKGDPSSLRIGTRLCGELPRVSTH